MKRFCIFAVLSTLACARQTAAATPNSTSPLSLRLPLYPKGPVHDLAQDLGNVVFLDVWASWCEPCKQALPAYRKMLQPFGSRIRVYAINVDADAAKVAEYLKQMPLPFPVLFDRDGQAAEHVLKVQVMPTSFVLDRRGVIRFVHRGYSTDLPDRLRAEIEQLLAEHP
jgi:cytochrome c biogenesis protein CcmG, thiol:disulfide interchange protein DsbE